MNTTLFFTLALILGLNCYTGSGFKFAPFYDTFLDNRTSILDFARETGQRDFHIAFALSSGFEPCVPMWGGQYPINDPNIINPLKELISMGGEIIVATGGALGPYLEHACPTAELLANAYATVLDTVGTRHIDLDIETSVDIEKMNRALAILQRGRPEIQIGFTLMVTGEDYGLTPQLGVELLRSAKANGLRVDTVNAMAMEYPKISDSFGESIINVGNMVLGQMADIWPEKSDSDLKAMLGITPMVGINFNGQIWQVEHAQMLGEWAASNNIGLVSFWSMERDNGRCPQTTSPSPYCSGISQANLEFTRTIQMHATNKQIKL